MGLEWQKSGLIGLLTTVVGIVLLGYTFSMAFNVFNTYFPFQNPGIELTPTLNMLLGASIQAMFLGVMAWVGSILLLRGVDFLKVDKGVGVVTFKVDKGVGVVSNIDERK
jgi:hypothetical protein